jgi:hypothetical protein
VRINGSNDFYKGWLACVLGLPEPHDVDDTKNEAWREGYSTAKETGPTAVLALQAEIARGHIVVTP